ncbi:DUF480 domain-containing protein [Serratia rubidaea]|uniref:DUF480 domain-containing protein n=1 Tax=Serratia rubidaea TaxID=61652 RepID=UPI0023B0A157|nr:DUF480 domain-containing protein [Serratia rubidaea]MDK1702854.1 DUF480 domain-containing protein [Serratia rubidaea]
MKYQLSAQEARVIGCLLEKQVTTPEQYPLSLNAITLACNQKTNREPVMTLSESEVQDVLDELVKKHFLRTQSGFGNRVVKYEQRFCNSEFGQLKLSDAELALVATLLLRGAQTPGELRTRAARLHDFNDVAEVELQLQQLAEREDGPFVRRLAREPGKRESRFVHLFGAGQAEPKGVDEPQELETSLSQRVSALEQQVAALTQQLQQLMTERQHD